MNFMISHNDAGDSNRGRRISDISEDFCGQLFEKVKLPSFALQVDKATDIIKDAHFIIYVCKICSGN